ncbi:MAG: endo-1,4-beta-xylanase, partial [Clostridia bacterium]|nr:endo-1,4-beta-xylanase [Clostridia bacterium]
MAYNFDCAQNLDLENLGLSEKIKADTKRHRMSAVSILVKDEEGNAAEGAKIEIKQTKNAFKFGCNAFIATQLPEKEQEQYDECFKKLFNQAVVPFYWHDDEPEEGVYRFKSGSPYIYRRPPADDVLAWCEKLGIEPKAHNMIWLNHRIGLPSWMPKDKTKLQKKLDDRVKMLSELYADKIPSWDVTNEVAAADIYEDMPEDFEVRAHKLADELFPDNHLIYNDYHGFYNQTYHGKRTNTYQIIKKILACG